MPWNVEERFHVIFGGNTFINTPTLLEYQGESLFTLERQEDTGFLAVTFRIYDEQGQHLGTVVRNAFRPNAHYSGSKTFAIKGQVHDWVVEEQTEGVVVCAIRKKEAAKPAELQLAVTLFTPDGFLVSATPEAIELPGVTAIGCTFEGLRAGIIVNRDGSVGLGAS